MHTGMVRRIVMGSLAAGVAISALLAVPVPARASSEDMRTLITTHRQAATDARQKITYHDQMRAKAAKRPQGGKFNMVKHCQRWSGYYRKVAEKNEAAATALEKQLQ